MIRDPECPRCYHILELDEGPASDPDENGNVVMERVRVCRVCDWCEPVVDVVVPESEWRRAIAAVRRIESLPDLDARGDELAREGYVIGHRWWPRAEA